MKTVVRHRADVFRCILLAGTACLLQACSAATDTRGHFSAGYPVGMAEQNEEELVAMLMDDTLEGREGEDLLSASQDLAEGTDEEPYELEFYAQAEAETRPVATEDSVPLAEDNPQDEVSIATDFELMNDEEGEEFATTAVEDSELDEQRGAAGLNPLVLSDVQGVSTGNTVNINNGTLFTGENKIDNNALTFSGVGTVIQNSGPNAVIQSSTVINATFINEPIQ